MARLVTYEDACRALASHLPGTYAGLAFALGPDGTGYHWHGVDLDSVSANRLDDLALEVPGLVEYSPSGNGCHAIGYGRTFAALASNITGIEAYSRGRFFTVTEQVIRDAPLACLADYVEQRLAPRHGVAKVAAINGVSVATVAVTPDVITDLRSALMYLRADDRGLWVAIGHALHELGEVGRELWLTWSATSTEHQPGPDAKTWDTFEPAHTGHAAVFKHAQAAGWINPRSKAAALPTAVFAPFAPLKTKPLPEFLAESPIIEFLVDDMFRRGWLYAITGHVGVGSNLLFFSRCERACSSSFVFF